MTKTANNPFMGPTWYPARDGLGYYYGHVHHNGGTRFLNMIPPGLARPPEAARPLYDAKHWCAWIDSQFVGAFNSRIDAEQVVAACCGTTRARDLSEDMAKLACAFHNWATMNGVDIADATGKDDEIFVTWRACYAKKVSLWPDDVKEFLIPV